MPFALKFLGIKIFGQEHLRTKGPFIIVANHNSHLDTMALMSSLSIGQLLRTHPVATAQYFGRKKWLVWLSNLFVNTVLIKRTDDLPTIHENASGGLHSNALILLEEKLSRGHSLILYPEGTRGEPEKIQDFRKGVGVLLQKFPNVLYIPVYMCGTGKILPKGAWLPVPYQATITIGEAKLITKHKVEEIVGEVKNAILDIPTLNTTT